MDEEVVVHINNGILLTIKRNKFESVLVRWINLEPIIQGEVKSERERQISYINAYICSLERWYQ